MDSTRESGDSVIKVSRPSKRLRDAAVSYTILVDGRENGTLDAGGVLEMRVSSGDHEVQAKVQSSHSRTVHVRTSAAAPVEITVRPAGRAFLFWKAFSNQAWLDLRVTSP